MHPKLIQGGMGIGVSNWRLAKVVSQCGQLGVVSGTAVDTLLIRRLQDGDEGGFIRRALAALPFKDEIANLLNKYFLPEGRKGAPYKLLPLHQKKSSRMRDLVSVIGGFCEVFLAKEGHNGVVGMNLMTKIQPPTIATIYGAMLAGIDYLLVGAGIPREIPGIVQDLQNSKVASLKLDVANNASGAEYKIEFDPNEFKTENSSKLKRPQFFPIVSSHSLAMMLAKKFNSLVDGFVVEHYKAGGHNAPPRDFILSPSGEPIYGERDCADIEKIKSLGKPFWLAGGCSNAKALDDAIKLGASGVQVGTLFAFAEESGIKPSIKSYVLEKAKQDKIEIFTDPNASPTGFPFKILSKPDSVSNDTVYQRRERKCDIGLLREAYERSDGSIGFRCSGEPVNEYLKKEGDIQDTIGRKCICNGLFSTVGLGQKTDEGVEEPELITAGEDFSDVKNLSLQCGGSYSAKEVVEYIVGK